MALQYITAETDNHLKMLIYGAPGVGKTSLLRTFPEDEPVCTLSAESGLLAVRDMVVAGKVSGVIINSLEDFNDCLGLFQRDESWRKFRWIFIDSLTEIATRCYEHYKNRHSNNNFALWEAYNFDMECMIKSFRDLKDFNVVFTCLEVYGKNELEQTVPLPDMPGRVLNRKLLSFFDEVFYMGFLADEGGAEPRRIFYTKPYSTYKAKDRSGRLAYVEEADIAHIQKKILS